MFLIFYIFDLNNKPMKTIIIILSAIAITSCVRFEVNPSSTDATNRIPVMQMIGGEYQPFSCSDSITSQSLMTVPTINNLSGKVYVFTGSDNDCSFVAKFKDPNFGRIESTDTIQCLFVHYTICGQSYDLITTGLPIITESAGITYIQYSDCILPMNGTNGMVNIRFYQ